MKKKIAFVFHFISAYIILTDATTSDITGSVLKTCFSRDHTCIQKQLLLRSDENPDGFKFDFDSELGRSILISPNTQLKTYFQIAEHFVTQDTQAYCGVASGTIILNSLGDKVKDPVDPVYDPYKYFTQKMFIKDPCVEKVMGISNYYVFMGMTLQQLQLSLQCFNAIVEKVGVSPQDNVQVVQTRIMQAIDAGKFVIANINRPELGEIGGGHFSPIAAYHKFNRTDESAKSLASFLFMDVARYKYRPIWVIGEHLVKAMSAIDGISGKSRGFLIIDYPAKDLPQNFNKNPVNF